MDILNGSACEEVGTQPLIAGRDHIRSLVPSRRSALRPMGCTRRKFFSGIITLSGDREGAAAATSLGCGRRELGQCARVVAGACHTRWPGYLGCDQRM